MIKQLTQFLNYGFFAEIALLIFSLVFVAVVIRTLLLHRDETTRQALIVLNDGAPTFRSGQTKSPNAKVNGKIQEQRT